MLVLLSLQIADKEGSMITFEEVMKEVPNGFEDNEAEAFAFWDNDSFENDEVCEFWDKFTEAFAGVWHSELDFAENLVEDLGYIDEMPEHIRGYFDYEAFARDLFMGDFFSTNAPMGIAVFRCNY